MTASRQPTAFLLQGPTFERVLANLTCFLSRLPMDKAWSVEVKPYRARRSDQQNRYLWGVVYATLEEATGQEAEDWHEYWLGEWGGWEVVDMLGQKKRKPVRRSSKLSRMEFADYVGFIQRSAAQHGIYIPDPDPIMEAA
jgi:hypothetical protein